MSLGPSGPQLPPLRRGDILDLLDEDYKYGRGALTLRVTGVHDVQHHRDGPWVFLRGVELRPDGREGQQRDVLVRGEALRTRRRRRRS